MNPKPELFLSFSLPPVFKWVGAARLFALFFPLPQVPDHHKKVCLSSLPINQSIAIQPNQ